MTLEILQNEMITAMKNGDKFTKTTISGLIAQIKKAAIDKGRRDNITEEFVNAELLKAKKQAQESIDGAVAAGRENLIEEYSKQFDIINLFAPQLIQTIADIHEIIDVKYEGPITKKDLMKWLNTNYRGKMDMGVAARVVDGLVKGAQPSSL